MLEQNYSLIKNRLHELAKEHCLPCPPVIVAVSKRKTSDDIRQMYTAGVEHFGENYLQEALEKIEITRNLSKLQWHYIGKIQSNKTKLIAQFFSWVHTIDNLKHATLLSRHRCDFHPTKRLNVCIQVNLHKELQKNGLPPEEVFELGQAITELKGLSLRGLMFIGKNHLSPQASIDSFLEMKHLFSHCKNHWLSTPMTQETGKKFDTLSMGMSADWQLAVAHGSTMIRLGTAIFGERSA